MNSHDINAALKKNGSSQAAIAASLRLAAPTVNKVVLGLARSDRVEEAISKATGLSVEVLWPQNYGGVKVRASLSPKVSAPTLREGTLRLAHYASERALHAVFKAKLKPSLLLLAQAYNELAEDPKFLTDNSIDSALVEPATRAIEALLQREIDRRTA
jgi:lambda repressor-like predicted transcriptional regulator